MRKFIILAFMLLLALNLLAENPKDEALKSLDGAKDFINQNNLVKAREEINYALAKIGEIQAEELLKYIPAAPAGFKLKDKNSQAMGNGESILGSVSNVTATANYTKGDAEIDLTISIGGILGQASGLAGLATMFAPGMGMSGGKTIRVKGYTGTLEYDKDEQSGTLTIQVGDKISVIVNGNDLESDDMLKTIAEAIDLAKLEKSF
jgi:hypothetical protein